MAVAIPQTSYALSQAAALPGMLADRDPGQLFITAIAAEDVLPGRVVE